MTFFARRTRSPQGTTGAGVRNVDMESAARKRAWTWFWIWGGTVLISAVVYVLDRRIGLDGIRRLSAAIRSDPRAAALFGLGYLVSYSTLPLSVFPIASGAIFGFRKGVLISNIAENLGALLPFLITRAVSRRAGRGTVPVAAPGANENRSHQTFTSILTARIIGLPHYTVINYAAAFSDIGVGRYVAANFLGMVLWLSTVAFVSNKLWTIALTEGESAFKRGLFMALWPLLVLKILVAGFVAAKAFRDRRRDAGEKKAPSAPGEPS